MSGSGPDTLPDVRKDLPDHREWLKGPSGIQGVVRRPSRMAGSGRETLPDVWVWSGGPLGCLGVVGSLFKMSGVVLIPSRMSGRTSQKSGGTYRMSGSGRLALPNVQEWSGDPPVCPGVVGRPSRMSGCGPDTVPNHRKDLPDVQEWSGVPPGCPGVVGRPSRMSGSGREAIHDVR